MTDLARLSIAIDSTSARTAASDLERLGNAGDVVKSKLTSMCKGIISMLGIVSFKNAITEVATLTARFDTLGIVMNTAGRNAGYSTGQMAQYEKALRKTGISALESRQSLASLAAANMDLTQSSKLARAAQDLAVVGNMNSSDAFNTLISGIQRGNTVVLRTLGLNMDFEKSYEKMAQSLKKKTSALTEQEKVQARVNAVLEQTAGYAGIYEQSMTTAGKKMQSLTRYVEDFKVALGEAFQPALAAGVDAVCMADAAEREKR